jgi:hypothetical protein
MHACCRVAVCQCVCLQITRRVIKPGQTAAGMPTHIPRPYYLAVSFRTRSMDRDGRTVMALKLRNIMPSTTVEIAEWWPAAAARFSVKDSKTANMFIILAMRMLWLETNTRVFERFPTRAQVTLCLMLEEWATWMQCRCGSYTDMASACAQRRAPKTLQEW